MIADPNGLAAELVTRSLAAADAAQTPRGDRPVRAGDLYSLPEAGDFPLEWAVLDRDPERPGGWLVVPADTFPVAGRADVAVPADAPAGPLTLRSRYGVWVAESALRPELWSGALEPAWARRARQLESSPEAEPELLPDPELEEWLAETVVPARDALARSAAALAEPRRERVAPPRWTLWRRRPIAQAAAAALLLGLGGSGGWLVADRRTLETEKARQEAVERARKSEAQVGKEISLRAQAERYAATLRAQIAAGRDLPSPIPQAIPNFPFASLEPDEDVKRGAADDEGVVEVREDTLFMLILEVSDDQPSSRYHLDITGRGRPPRSLDGLTRKPGGTISLGLSSQDFPAGEYHLQLRSSDGRWVAFYTFRVK